MARIMHRAWVIDLRCKSLLFFWQPKEKPFVPAVDERCFKELFSSGLLNISGCIPRSSFSFISIILSTAGLLHQMSENCEKLYIPTKKGNFCHFMYLLPYRKEDSVT